MTRRSLLPVFALAGAVLPACAPPCTDDGFAQYCVQARTGGIDDASSSSTTDSGDPQPASTEVSTGDPPPPSDDDGEESSGAAPRGESSSGDVVEDSGAEADESSGAPSDDATDGGTDPVGGFEDCFGHPQACGDAGLCAGWGWPGVDTIGWACGGLCSADADCGDPPSPDMAVRCLPYTGTQDVCVLRCDGGNVCPDGMACIDEVCAWPSAWTCAPAYYGTNDGCDCGCGASDSDCATPGIGSCEWCGNPGSCSDSESCPGEIDPDDTAHCL